MRKKIFSKCPFCGHENMTIEKFTESNTVDTIFCNEDPGEGCGKEYAIRYRMEILAYVESSKLEFK